MAVEERALELADVLERFVDRGGAILNGDDCELAAKALRWFALIAQHVSERAEPLDESASTAGLPWAFAGLN